MATDDQIAAAVEALTGGAAGSAGDGPESPPAREGQGLPQGDDTDAPAAPSRASSGEPDPEPVTGDELPMDDDSGADPPADDTDDSIDYDLMVPMPDGRESMRLGDMKDLATDIARRESQIQERETQAMAQADELRQLLSMVGEIPPQVRAAAQARQTDHLKREHAAMLDALPEMGTREGFERITKEIHGTASQYGFTAQEIAAVSDHRLVKLLKDYGDLKARVATAKKQVQPASKKQQRVPQGRKANAVNGAGNQAKMIEAAAASRDQNVKIAAAAKLLGG